MKNLKFKIPKLSRKKLIWLVIIILLVITGSVVQINNINSARKQEIANLAIGEVKEMTLQKKVFASAEVSSKNITNIYADQTGRAHKIFVKEGDRVNSSTKLIEYKVNDPFDDDKYSTQYTDVTGVVTKVLVNRNQATAVGQSLVLEIQNLNSLELESYVSETDVSKVKVGQPAIVDINALNLKGAVGNVSFIAKYPAQDNVSSDSYKTIVSFPDTKKYPELQNAVIGLNANVEITVDELKDVLSVEDIYVFKQDNKNYVRKIIKKTDLEIETKDIEVEIGFIGDNGMQILKGINKGDLLILPSVEVKSRLPSSPFSRT